MYSFIFIQHYSVHKNLNKIQPEFPDPNLRVWWHHNPNCGIVLGSSSGINTVSTLYSLYCPDYSEICLYKLQEYSSICTERGTCMQVLSSEVFLPHDLIDHLGILHFQSHPFYRDPSVKPEVCTTTFIFLEPVPWLAFDFCYSVAIILPNGAMTVLHSLWIRPTVGFFLHASHDRQFSWDLSLDDDIVKE